MSEGKIDLSREAQDFERLMSGISDPPTELDTIRDKSGRLQQAASEPERVIYREVDANGVPGIWVEPLDADTSFVLIHAHAGGSVTTTAAVDRKFVGHIAKAAGIPALVVDFRLSPEHKYPAQLDDVESAFTWLVSEGFAPNRIISMGHSIGGYLSVALALRLRDAGEALPGAIVSISPWANLELTDASIDSHADVDKLLSRRSLEFFRSCWIDGTDVSPDDVRINLNRADLAGLPPTFVSWGSCELFTDGSEEFARRLHAAGVPTDVLEVRGAQHSYVWSAGRVPETDAAIEKLAAWVRTTLPVGRDTDGR